MERAELSKLFSEDPRSAREWSNQAAVALAQQPTLVAGIYMAGIAVAEIVIVLGPTTVGLGLDGLILLLTLTHYVLLTQSDDRERLGRVGGLGLPVQAERFRRILPALALLPLLRILSLVMPVRTASNTAWYVLVGAPLLLGALLAMRALGIGLSDMGLGRCRLAEQIPIALTGLPVAVSAYAIIRPRPLIAHPSATQALVAVAILVVFSAFVEELIFRGLMQIAAVSLFGPFGIAWSASLFALFYLGSLSPAYVLIMLATGLFFGWCVLQTGSLWGVIASHGLINVGALVVLPLVWK